MDREIEEFKRYTSNYLYLGSNIDLKINHTLRVMKLCDDISRSLGLSDEEVYICKICGLLHDIGRFEQYKRFNTFKDSDSIDHGDLGVEILLEDNYLRKYIKDNKYDQIILKSIKNHNKFKIEDGLNDKEKLFCEIVRDADKIDILYLYVCGEINISSNNECFSTDVYNNLLNGKEISKDIKVTKADNLSISIGFLFDINYKKSFKILKDNNYYNLIINKFINDSNNLIFKEQLENIRVVINDYLERMIIC